MAPLSVVSSDHDAAVRIRGFGEQETHRPDEIRGGIPAQKSNRGLVYVGDPDNVIGEIYDFGVIVQVCA